MSLVPYDPFRQLSNFQKEFTRFFPDFPHFFDQEQQFGAIRVDVHENDQEVVVTCDIPGLERKEDVQLHIENNHLNISGTVHQENEVKKEHMYRKERYVGSFQRGVRLPSAVSDEGVKATYKNGVLEVHMEKLMTDTKTKIDVDFH